MFKVAVYRHAHHRRNNESAKYHHYSSNLVDDKGGIAENLPNSSANLYALSANKHQRHQKKYEEITVGSRATQTVF